MRANMPPTLDLSRTKHPMIVSSPRINLRRTASYNHEKVPLSSTSSRFNFNHLLFSPPPSPGLPALTPRPRKSPVGLVRPTRAFRLVGWVVGTLVFFCLVVSIIRQASIVPLLSRPSRLHNQYRLISRDSLPDSPTAVIVTDSRGRTKWTVSIPPHSEFPLSTGEYSELCAKCREVSDKVHGLHADGHGIFTFGSPSSGSPDPHFIDVRESEEYGILASAAGRGGVLNKQSSEDDETSLLTGGTAEALICETSMTFVLDPIEAGLGKTLMMLWTAYGLARKEGRSFFIDDSRWAYGKYADIFQPPPAPGCRRPARHEMLPCPRQARHLVVSTTTAPGILGAPVGDPQTAETMSISTRKQMFQLARDGCLALFKLNKEDGDYVDARVHELTAKKLVPRTQGDQNGMAVGMHIRRGDQHPLEYQYRFSYMPINVYTEAARRLQDDRYGGSLFGGGEDKAAKEHSFLILASDDPTAYESEEFADASRAQERIKLANKVETQETNPDRHVMRKFVDETFGWEGGFFAPMFWNLGVSTSDATSTPSSAPSADTMRLRSLLGRAYMMDLAVLAEASDVVVCTVSATGCRLLAVMMGWEKAMDKGHWVNIDGQYGWTGISA